MSAPRTADVLRRFAAPRDSAFSTQPIKKGPPRMSAPDSTVTGSARPNSATSGQVSTSVKTR